ncbi:MAG TPA: peroxiredoxin [Ktedonobacterales bacterium]|nr:peroxiredoxin [Ktedonobacterales bacterium]
MAFPEQMGDGEQGAHSSKRVGVGDLAPDFALPAHAGEEVRLSAYRGKRVVVLYFYPKDETPGCTAEACAFRDSYEVFTEAGAEVIGISSDSVESHDGFAAHHRLPFVLVSDQGGAVRKQYQVPSTFGLLPGRVTYVIDQQGIVRYMFAQQLNAAQHVREALRVVRELRGE